jgi:ribosomal protein S18 acetylase RimI-like enzyme
MLKDVFATSMLLYAKPDTHQSTEYVQSESSSSAARQLALLKRSGLFSDDTKGCVIERATSSADLLAAYRLVHSVFLSTGYIQPETGGVRVRIFEANPETATFVAKKDGAVVGVLSVVIDSPDMGLPSDAAFKPELDAMRALGARIGEVTNQAIAKEYRRSGVMTELMRCVIAHGLAHGCDRGVVTVSPNHGGFYELMGFRSLGSERSYSAKLHDPVIALGLDLDFYRYLPDDSTESERFVHRFMTETNPYISRAAKWSQQAKNHFLRPALLRELFVTERNFLGERSLTELLNLRIRWGEELFDSVWETAAAELGSSAPFALPERQPVPLDRFEMSSEWSDLKGMVWEYMANLLRFCEPDVAAEEA